MARSRFFSRAESATSTELRWLTAGASLRSGAGTAKHPKVGALRSIPRSVCSKDFSNTNEQGANRRPSLRPARGPKTICLSAACSARCEPAKSSTNTGSASRSRRFGTHDVLRGLDYLRNAGIKPDSRVSDAIETVIERRHQNGRWPVNLLHPEHIPVEMETGVGRASRWNTLRALRVLCWYTTQRGRCDLGLLALWLGPEVAPRTCLYWKSVEGCRSSE